MNKSIFKKITIFISTLSFLSIFPLAFISIYSRPSGDDFGYSAASHVAWITTHSLWNVLQAGLETTKDLCTYWNGDWFSVFVFTWMPEAFIPYSFPIVPFLFLFLNIGITLLLSYEFLHKRVGFEKSQSIAIGSIILALEYLFIPGTSCLLFWWVGVIHYLMPHIFAMLSLIYISKYIACPKKRHLWLLSFLAIGIGGSSYYSYFIILFIYLLIIVIPIWKDKRRLLFLIPLCIGTLSVAIQVAMPGNRGRISGLEYENKKVFATIIEAIITAAKKPFEYIHRDPLIGVGLLILAALICICISCNRAKYSFAYPILFVGYMFGIYASMFTPELYVATDISNGPKNMEYITFLLFFCASCVYIFGWCKNKFANTNIISSIIKKRKYIGIIYIFVILALIIVFRGNIKDTHSYEALDYYFSGQADDFKEQIHSQMDILMDDTIKEAYVCPTNSEQGPLFHMPVIDNPDAYTNQVVSSFYQKDFVIAR